MFKKILAVLIVISVVGGVTALAVNRKEPATRVFYGLFDTSTVVSTHNKNAADFEKLTNEIYKELQNLNELFDAYTVASGRNNIRTINENAGKEAVKVEQDIIDLLMFGKEAYTLTDGRVNIAMGSVTRLWKDAEKAASGENPSIPDSEALKEAGAHTDINKVIIDPVNSTVFIEDEKMALDVGAIAKGFVLDILPKRIVLKNVLISLGGSVTAYGKKNFFGSKWKVGITDPLSTEKITETVHLSDVSIATSGDYERFFTIGDTDYHHIIDPKTLMPSKFSSSVSIIAKNAALCDAFSTACFLQNPEDAVAFLNSKTETEGLIISSGRTYASDRFKDYKG